MNLSAKNLYARIEKRFENRAGWYFDESRGIVEISGPDRIKFLHALVTSDVKGAQVGTFQKTCILNPKGKIMEEGHFMFLPQAVWFETASHRIGGILDLFKKYRLASKVEVANVSPRQKIARVFSAQDDSMDGFQAFGKRFASMAFPHSVTLIVPVEEVETLKSSVQSDDRAFIVDEDLHERLRVRCGIPKIGVDVDDSTLIKEVPYYEDAISYTKGCYPGQEVVARLHSRGDNVARRFMGVHLPGEGEFIGEDLLHDGQKVGTLTSVVSLGPEEMLGLALVHRSAFLPDTEVNVSPPDRACKAKIVSLPF